MMKKIKEELKGPRKPPWPPKLTPFRGNDHRSPALRWSMLIFNMELRKNGLEVGNQFIEFLFDLPQHKRH
jgi:hypothetical protein